MGSLLPLLKFKCFHALFLITFLIISPSNFVTEASTALNTTTNGEQQILLLIKSQLFDPFGALTSWRNNFTSFCQWRGVSCNNNQTQVIGLNLGSLALSGELTPYITNLTFLQRIDLSNNKFSGGIPREFGRFSHLVHLNLSMNSLNGKIHSGIINHPSLVSIDLSKNRLHGSIPDFVSNRLLSLEHLSLARNNLTGTFPESIGNASSLIYLDLSENLLEGIVPQNIQKNQNLQHLDLYSNYIEKVPNSLYNITSLRYLDLSYNELSGTLPSTIGHTLPNIQTMNLAVNQFAGSIPTSLSNASRLEVLVLAANNFHGEVPNRLQSLRELTKLDLSWNQLESGDDWSFLSSLTNCKKLRFLNLQGNNLTGSLPTTVGNLTSEIEVLLLGNNDISGTIPNEIGNLMNLTALYLDRNYLTGIVPPTIGSLRNLQTLQLSKNMLSGPIPFSIGNLTQLSELYLMENRLNGTIPTSIGNCTNLLRVKLCINNIEGNIPKEIFSITTLTQELDLGNNFLEGTIPPEVGSLISLSSLDFSNNSLHGEIPKALGSCQMLQYLILGGNHFNGTIPESLVNLKGIAYLDLSVNNLSGKIPEYFESFRFLEYLNLSFNSLEGNVPEGGVFSNASEVSLFGNTRLCGGESFLGLPPCSIHSSKHKLILIQLTLLIVAASAVLISVLVLSIGTVVYRRKKKRGVNPGEECIVDEIHRKVSYYELLRATNGFSVENFIGRGSFGSVYRGNLDDEGHIAVKVFDLNQTGGVKCFSTECDSLRNIRHKNLVNVITSCSTVDPKGNEFKALVFKCITNGSLEEWIHPMVQGKKLSLAQRINVASDMAQALSYLHHHCMPPLVHCDLKPSNVLIDGDMNALVADFGLARFLPDFGAASTQSATSLMGLKGTIGYIAPEYALGGQISVLGDVYSYGILLLEMLTGKRPTDDMFTGSLTLHSYVNAAFPGKIEEVLDPTISEEIKCHLMEKCVTLVLQVGISCSKEAPKDRMSMMDVAAEISSVREALLKIENHSEEVN